MKTMSNGSYISDTIVDQTSMIEDGVDEGINNLARLSVLRYEKERTNRTAKPELFRNQDLPAQPRASDVQQYNPADGAMKVHATNAAMVAAKRTKDPSALHKAIRANFEAKRDFAEHYRAQFPHGGDRIKQDDSTVAFEYCRQFGLHIRAVQRWGTQYLDPEDFISALDNAKKKIDRQFIDEPKATRGTLGTGDSEWYTPLQYIESARSPNAAVKRSMKLYIKGFREEFGSHGFVR